MDFTTVLLWFFVVLLLSLLMKLSNFAWQILFNTLLFNTKSIDLHEKFGDWAVVTGSTDGIGKEYAKELAKRGMNIVLISRSIERLEATRDEIKSINPNVEVKIIQADFSEGKDAIEKIEREMKDIPVGLLVNNVGSNAAFPQYFGEISRTDLWNMISVNVGATALMTHLVIKKMKERKKGAIVNVSSGTDAMPLPLLSFYSASKTLMRYWSDAIRTEYSQYGITIQVLSPYYVTTKMVDYNRFIQGHQVLFPDPETYAKNAVNTLGKLNSTAGYCLHDLFYNFALIFPMWLRTKVSFIVTSIERNDYLKLRK